MERFFSGDNPVIGFLNDVVDLIILELVWFVLCIPVFTVGASTSAFYYAVNKVIRKKKGQVLPEFWRAFKEGFKNSSVIWLIVAEGCEFENLQCSGEIVDEEGKAVTVKGADGTVYLEGESGITVTVGTFSDVLSY